jgi:hypothetical protein
MEQSLEALLVRRQELLQARQVEFDARTALLKIAEVAGRGQLDDAEWARYQQHTDAMIEIDAELSRIDGRIAELRR